MKFRVQGLAPEMFGALHTLSDAALAAQGAQRVEVSAPNAAPCRISLDDAAPGERVILLNYQHLNVETPYRQQGPIFVREGAARFDGLGVTPPALLRRMLSLRGFNSAHMMIEADLVDGGEATALIARFFANADVAYIHAHYARRGCFAARIDRG